MRIASEHPEVVKAAIDALVQSASPLAVNSLQEVWQYTAAESLRVHIVDSVLNAQDFRQANLIEQYAYKMLREAQGLDTADQNTNSGEDAPPTAPPAKSTRTTAAKSTTAKTTAVSLRRVLNYLENQDRSGIRDAARRAVPHIRQPDVQDSIVHFLVKNTTEQDQQLATVIRSYVT